MLCRFVRVLFVSVSKAQTNAPQTGFSQARDERKNMSSNSPKKSSVGQEPTESSQSNHDNRKKYPWTFKRVAALIGIIVLAGMYVVTLIAAIIDAPGSGRLFRTSLGLTIAIPIILWILIWCVGKFRPEGSMADFHILEDDKDRSSGKETPDSHSGSSGSGESKS